MNINCDYHCAKEYQVVRNCLSINAKAGGLNKMESFLASLPNSMSNLTNMNWPSASQMPGKPQPFMKPIVKVANVSTRLNKYDWHKYLMSLPW